MSRQLTKHVRSINKGGWANFAALAGLFLCGCSSELLEEVSEQSYPADPQIEITVQNTDGTIQLYGSEKPQVRLQTIRKAYTSARLRAISTKVNAENGNMTIDTQMPAPRRWTLADRSGTVDYIIVVPKAAKSCHVRLRNGEILVAGMENSDVHITLENGRIFVRNCFSNVQASSGTGAIALIYDWWQRRKFSADLEMADGNLFAVIPSDATFHVHAEAPKGKIGNDFAEKEERTGATITKIDNVIGDAPEAAITLRAQDGNIKIVEANP